jgi:hypothetical protein
MYACMHAYVYTRTHTHACAHTHLAERSLAPGSQRNEVEHLGYLSMHIWAVRPLEEVNLQCTTYTKEIYIMLHRIRTLHILFCTHTHGASRLSRQAHMGCAASSRGEPAMHEIVTEPVMHE